MSSDVVTPWSSLSPAARGEGVSIAWIGSDGVYWPLAGGGDGGAMGAFISGPIDGMVHIEQTGVWTKPAYGPPRFQRVVDNGKQIHFMLGLMSDSALGWYDTETKFWQGCTTTSTGFFVVTTRRHGQLWLPMQLFEAPKCALEDDPSGQRVLLHEVTLAVDGEPRWRRPDKMPDPFISPGGTEPADVGYITVGNASTIPTWPIFFVTGPAKAVYLPDGPNAYTSNLENPLNDWPRISALFDIPFLDNILGLFTAKRNATMIPIPPIPAGTNVIVDTDPTHRIAIATTDPVDTVIKQFIRNSDLLSLLTQNYGATGLPYAQQFSGEGFSIPIPPNSVAKLPVQHDTAGGKIWCQLPQRFESALA